MKFSNASVAGAIIASVSLKPVGAYRFSTGCTKPSPTYSENQSWDQDVVFEGTGYNHKFSLPSGYAHGDEGSSSPIPLLLFFHGWGGSSSDCGTTCNTASSRGYATISLTGMGGENGDYNSWRGFGSTSSGEGVASHPVQALTAPEDTCGSSSSNENDRTCNTDAYNVKCYKDCNKSCQDSCWWTTCKDSVQQTLEVLETFLDTYCIDLDRIYASGCSNGGMFLYELAQDSRTAPYLAAISPQVGLPHYGYNVGPNQQYGPIHHIGFWGTSDATVPPLQGPSSGNNCEVECRTSESQGWFYTDSKCVTEKWADVWALNPATEHEKYGIPSYNKLTECWSYTNQDYGSEVVIGCLFNGGHVCNTKYMNEVTLNFFDSHSKANNLTTTTSTSTSTSTTATTSTATTTSGAVTTTTSTTTDGPDTDPGTIVDQECPCDDGWWNYREYKECVLNVTGELEDMNVTDYWETQELVKERNKKYCGFRYRGIVRGGN